jgi:hypothetical protein
MSLKAQFESKKYNISDIPRVLEMENEEVFINKKGLYPNELESLLQKNNNLEETHLVLAKKLKAVSCGDWQFHLGMINIMHFESRDKFDNMLMQIYETSISTKIKNIERISIQNALEHYIDVTFSIDMDYYLQNRNEIEIDLDRKVSDFDLKDDLTRTRIEQELFYKQMCSIIGVMEDDDGIMSKDDNNIYDKSYFLKDFRLLSDKYGSIHATAQRGRYFLVFFYVSS